MLTMLTVFWNKLPMRHVTWNKKNSKAAFSLKLETAMIWHEFNFSFINWQVSMWFTSHLNYVDKACFPCLILTLPFGLSAKANEPGVDMLYCMSSSSLLDETGSETKKKKQSSLTVVLKLYIYVQFLHVNCIIVVNLNICSVNMFSCFCFRANLVFPFCEKFKLFFISFYILSNKCCAVIIAAFSFFNWEVSARKHNHTSLPKHEICYV